MAKATLVVVFGDGVEAGFVKAEFDEIENVNAAGEVKTQFVPGDEPYFLVQHDPTLRIDRVASTDGMAVSNNAEETRTRTTALDFAQVDDTVELDYLPAGSGSRVWYGNVPTIATDGRAITATGGQLPAKGLATYPTTWQSYRLIPPPLTLAAEQTYEITIYIYMEAA